MNIEELADTVLSNAPRKGCWRTRLDGDALKLVELVEERTGGNPPRQRLSVALGQVGGEAGVVSDQRPLRRRVLVPVTPEALAEQVVTEHAPLSKLTEQDLAEELQRRGLRVKLEKKTGEGEVTIPDLHDKDRIRFAVASDFHLCSRFQQLTALRSFYKIAKKRKCEFVLCPGDLVEGSHKMHRDAAFYQFVHGADAQIDYAIAHIPDEGLRTYAINGNHDYSHWNDAGVSVARRVAAERDDIEYIGDLGASVHIGPLKSYLWHPMGGAAYARSYKLQKWIEQRPIEHRPDILFGGHIHIACHVPNYSGVEAFLVGCFQAQTPFINRLALTPNVSGLILDIGINDAGKIGRISSEWFHFPEWIRDDY